MNLYHNHLAIFPGLSHHCFLSLKLTLRREGGSGGAGGEEERRGGGEERREGGEERRGGGFQFVNHIQPYTYIYLEYSQTSSDQDFKEN